MIATVALAAAAAALAVGDTVAARRRFGAATGAASPSFDPRQIPLVTSTVAAVTVMAQFGAVTAAMLFAAMALLWTVRRRAAERRRRYADEAAIPAVCRVLASELDAGTPALRALEVAASSAPPGVAKVLREAAAAERIGLSAAGRLTSAAGSCASLRFVGVCWSLSSRTGSSLAPTLRSVASALQHERDAADAVEAELVGPRLSARVMAVLPLFGLLLGIALGTDPFGFLFGTTIGRACGVGSVALDVLGLLWITRLAAAATR